MQLREYLKIKGITIPAFAEMIGVSVQAVHRYVEGKRIPQREVMKKIKAATDGSVGAEDFYETCGA